MPVLPFHKYVGPGNSLEQGEPVDLDDQIARIHDRAYADAVSDLDVRQADRDAIEHFLVEGANDETGHSLLGAIGIGAKYAVESASGVLYGRGAKNNQAVSRKRTHDISDTDSIPDSDPEARDPHEPKREYVPREIAAAVAGSKDKPVREEDHLPIISDSESERETETDVMSAQGSMETNAPVQSSSTYKGPEGGNGGGSGTGQEESGMDLVTHNSLLSPKNLYITFRRKWILQVPSFQYINNQTTSTNGPWTYLPYSAIDPHWERDVCYLLRTPLQKVPADALPFYMSRAEYEQLPAGSFAKSCRVVCKPREFRTPFQTGSDIAGYANAHIGVTGYAAVGLNKLYQCVHGSYFPDPAAPTDPNLTDKSFDYFDIEHSLWNTGDSSEIGNIPASLMVPRHINKYLQVSASNIHTNHRMGDYIKTFLFDKFQGKTVIDFKYNFKCAPLTWKANFRETIREGPTPARMITQEPTSIGYGRHPYWGFISGDDNDPTLCSDTSTSEAVQWKRDRLNCCNRRIAALQRPSSYFNYQTRLEKADICTFGQNSIGKDAQYMPLPYIGLMPLYASNFTAPQPSFADIVSTWEVDAALDVEIPFHSASAQNMQFTESGFWLMNEMNQNGDGKPDLWLNCMGQQMHQQACIVLPMGTPGRFRVQCPAVEPND